MSLPDIRRRSRKWLSVEEIRFLILLLIFILAMLALNMYLARTLPGGEWLYLRWSGARAFLIEKIEPYGTEISQRVRLQLLEKDVRTKRFVRLVARSHREWTPAVI